MRKHLLCPLLPRPSSPVDLLLPPGLLKHSQLLVQDILLTNHEDETPRSPTSVAAAVMSPCVSCGQVEDGGHLTRTSLHHKPEQGFYHLTHFKGQTSKSYATVDDVQVPNARRRGHRPYTSVFVRRSDTSKSTMTIKLTCTWSKGSVNLST